MTITVSCPACNSHFPVDPAKVPPGGILAQCSECPTVFRVEAPDRTDVQGLSDGLGDIEVLSESSVETSQEIGNRDFEPSEGRLSVDVEPS